MANYKYIVGIDESGRGPLAGAVVAAALIMSNVKCQMSKPNVKCQILKKLKDSKKLSAKKREKFYKLLKDCPIIEWGIGRAGERVIDKINILQATKLAMIRAVNTLKSKIKNQKSKIDLLLIDGNFGINIDIPQKSIVKGDEKVFLIKLASIIAKVARDRTMLKEHRKYPQYGFDKHKGYPTLLHKEMLKKYGPCKIHRMSFKPLKT